MPSSTESLSITIEAVLRVSFLLSKQPVHTFKVSLHHALFILTHESHSRSQNSLCLSSKHLSIKPYATSMSDTLALRAAYVCLQSTNQPLNIFEFSKPFWRLGNEVGLKNLFFKFSLCLTIPTFSLEVLSLSSTLRIVKYFSHVKSYFDELYSSTWWTKERLRKLLELEKDLY